MGGAPDTISRQNSVGIQQQPLPPLCCERVAQAERGANADCCRKWYKSQEDRELRRRQLRCASGESTMKLGPCFQP